MSFWRRNKRKLVAAAAVGAAGAAAYYWWTSESDEQASERRRRDEALAELQSIVHGDRRRTPTPVGGLGGGGGGEDGDEDGEGGEHSLDDSLQAHFDSIQVLSERQALEDLLPRLRDALWAATAYEGLRERLRQPGLPPAEKRALWAQLAGQAFTRAMGGVWLVPLLDLLVRLKLHIVARHMYLEVQLPGLTPRGAGRGGLGGGGLKRGAMPPRLSDRAKEEFFRSDFFVDVGAAGLLHKLRRAVDTAVSAVDFGGAVAPADVERLVVAVHARFEAEFQRDGDVWAAYLVPPGGQPVSVQTLGGLESFMAPSEAATVDELNAELREAAGDYRFLAALRAGVRHTSRVMGSYVASKMGGSGGGGGGQEGGGTKHEVAGGGAQQEEGRAEERPAAPPQPRPFPFVVPIVAKSSQLLFDEANRCTRGLSSIREVQSLCASIFTFGPHIQDGFSPFRAR
ncbi:MAG: hypothetical protein J3K34DRAFT_517044 [Monoraphidium minutum]|nr:MAG: hypothetical protein J3K34DRAFT_517044 [Monoraphidium minutum]